MAPSGLWTIGIKKGLGVLGTQLGSRVTKVHSCITEALQDMRTRGIIITYKTCGHATTVRLNSAAPCDCPLTGTDGRGCDPTGATGWGALQAAKDIICYS
jgi:hypothetical protein